MRKTTKLLSMLLAVVSCGSVVACGGGSGGQTTGDGGVEISIMNTDGGVGQVWLENAMTRFAEKVKDKDYGGGQIGVKFKPYKNSDTGVATMKTSGYNIYFDSNTPSIMGLSLSDSLVDITDIVTTPAEGETKNIESKIVEDYRSTCKGKDDKYYALPHFALNSGLTYDVELFEAEGMYLAAPDAAEADKEVYSAGAIGSATFLTNPNGKKSCGNDGKYGTPDDGLPTSMVEFFILCDRLKDAGIEPIAFAGASLGYTNYLYNALWASLSGNAEAANTRYSFTGKGEFVQREGDEYAYYDEPVWAGFDVDVCGAKPKTQELTLVRTDNGYRANDSAARYYALAAMKVLEDQGWFSRNSYQGTKNTAAMSDFLLAGKGSKPKQAMFIEGDYWYNEAVDNGKVDEYKELANTTEDRKIAWMALPTHAYESVTGPENARKYVMINENPSYAFINNNIKDNAVLLAACKDFLQFCYSDAELSYFTGLTGIAKAGMEYEILDDHKGNLAYYHQELIKVRDDANTVKLNAVKDSLYSDAITNPTLGGRKYNNYLQAMRLNESLTVADIFKDSRSKSEGWGVENL